MTENDAITLQNMAIDKWRMNVPLTQQEYELWLNKLQTSPPVLSTAGQSELLGLMDRFNGVLQQMQANIQQRVKEFNVPAKQ